MIKEVYFDREIHFENFVKDNADKYWNYVYKKYTPVEGKKYIMLDDEDELFCRFNFHGRTDNSLSFLRRAVEITEEDGRLCVTHYKSMEIEIPIDTEMFSIGFTVYTKEDLAKLFDCPVGVLVPVLELAPSEPLHLNAGDKLVIKPFYSYIDKL